MDDEFDEEYVTKKSKKLTVRQRAMADGGVLGELLELPMSNKPKKQLTEEELQKKNAVAQKRKQVMMEQLEEEKRETVEKLLMNQSNREKRENKAARIKANLQKKAAEEQEDDHKYHTIMWQSVPPATRTRKAEAPPSSLSASRPATLIPTFSRV